MSQKKVIVISVLAAAAVLLAYNKNTYARNLLGG